MTKIHECTWTEQALASVKYGNADASLLEHIAQCEQCRHEALLVRAMQAVQADALERTGAVPAPKRIWLKAQFSNKQENLSKIELIKLLGFSSLGAIGCIAFIVKYLFHASIFPNHHGSMNAPFWVQVMPIGIPVALALAVVVAVWVFSLELYFTRR